MKKQNWSVVRDKMPNCIRRRQGHRFDDAEARLDAGDQEGFRRAANSNDL
jgi:hypothetical protein